MPSCWQTRRRSGAVFTDAHGAHTPQRTQGKQRELCVTKAWVLHVAYRRCTSKYCRVAAAIKHAGRLPAGCALHCPNQTSTEPDDRRLPLCVSSLACGTAISLPSFPPPDPLRTPRGGCVGCTSHDGRPKAPEAGAPRRAAAATRTSAACCGCWRASAASDWRQEGDKAAAGGSARAVGGRQVCTG